MGRKNISKQRRLEIVSAFSRVLANHGYAGATIEAVALEAELSPGLLHHHFKNKGEILEELLSVLISQFRENFEDRSIQANEKINAYIDAALSLDHRSDTIAAKCWVGILAEGVRNPKLFERIKRYLEKEVVHIESLSQGKLNTKDSSTILAFIFGSLVFGAYAPRRTAGFAAQSGKKISDMLML